MRKLLLVDDDRSFLEILSLALSKDFEIHKATGISEALTVLKEGVVDFICSDLNMKDGSGLDLLQFLKSNYTDIPFILLSGQEDCIEIKLAKHYGATFIPKGSADILAKIKYSFNYN